MKKCAKCGQEYDSNFCPNCGSQEVATEEPKPQHTKDGSTPGSKKLSDLNSEYKAWRTKRITGWIFMLLGILALGLLLIIPSRGIANQDRRLFIGFLIIAVALIFIVAAVFMFNRATKCKPASIVAIEEQKKVIKEQIRTRQKYTFVKNRGKIFFVSCICLFVAITAGITVWFFQTAWTRDLTLKYVDSGETYAGDTYKLYEISNNTSRALKNVTAVIKVKNGISGSWTFDDNITYSLEQGETVEYRLYWSDVQNSADERDTYLSFASTEIVKIKY